MNRSNPKPLYFTPEAEPEVTTELCTAADIAVPARIQSDPQKHQLWKYLVADLEHRRILSPTYTLLVSELVEVTSLMLKCRSEMDEHGEMIDIFNDEGQWIGQRPSPWFTMLHKQQAIQIKLFEKLGLTPRDITFLVTPDASPIEAIRQITSEAKEITYFRT
jgi:phage terminase small subunit